MLALPCFLYEHMANSVRDHDKHTFSSSFSERSPLTFFSFGKPSYCHNEEIKTLYASQNVMPIEWQIMPFFLSPYFDNTESFTLNGGSYSNHGRINTLVRAAPMGCSTLHLLSTMVILRAAL